MVERDGIHTLVMPHDESRLTCGRNVRGRPLPPRLATLPRRRTNATVPEGPAPGRCDGSRGAADGGCGASGQASARGSTGSSWRSSMTRRCGSTAASRHSGRECVGAGIGPAAADVAPRTERLVDPGRRVCVRAVPRSAVSRREQTGGVRDDDGIPGPEGAASPPKPKDHRQQHAGTE
jgi:hypothetical protein